MVVGGTVMKKRAYYYYKLWFAETGGAICRPADLKGVSEYFIFQPEPVREWPEGVIFYAEGEPLEDYLYPIGVWWVIVSERVKQALEDLEATEGVQFLPIRVIRKETGEEVPGYYVLHVWRHIAALDEEHTKFFEPRNEIQKKHFEMYPEFRIAVVALRREALRDVDIFQLKERSGSIYVSRRVKKRLEEMGATGFKWIRVPSF
jgi:hypothetical protein